MNTLLSVLEIGLAGLGAVVLIVAAAATFVLFLVIKPRNEGTFEE